MIIGKIENVAYNSDAKVFWSGGICPTLRAESHGHLPNILVYETYGDTDERTERGGEGPEATGGR